MFVFKYFVIFGCISMYEASVFRCDYDYYSELGGWFKLHNNPVSRRTANAICHLEGATLASPLVIPYGLQMKNLMSSIMKEDVKVTTVHVSTADPNASVGPEPRLWVMTDEGLLIHVNSSSRHAFICHRKGKNVEINECGTTDDEYKLDNRTGHCYKFHRMRNTWSGAENICSVEGGYLAVINSDDEATVIREVFARNPSDSIPGYTWRDSAFVGYFLDTNDFIQNKWFTIHGQKLSVADKAQFAPGEPNNARGDENCGSVGRNGLLYDDPCDRQLPFICEKLVGSLLCSNEEPARELVIVQEDFPEHAIDIDESSLPPLLRL